MGTLDLDGVLAFERDWWRHGTSKDAVIRDRLGMRPARYRRIVAAAVAQTAAGTDPSDADLVERLRRRDAA